MSSSKSDLLNLLTLPPLQRKIIVHLTRQGPADTQALIQALGQDSTKVQQALAILVQKGHVQISADGKADVYLGKTRRRTLPARLWPALLATSRLYSTQEIATLRTAVPILQFARAKVGEMLDHGPSHALRVKSFATQLGYILDLTPTEQHLLRAAALFHDVGNIVDRGRHHIISQETVERMTAAGELPFSATEAALVGLLCRWHRKEYDPDQHDDLRRETVRTGLLASILRVADAMDIDHRRSDYADHFTRIVFFFYPEEIPHFASVKEILGLRIRCAPAVTLQVFTQGQVKDNMQITMMRKDLASTPLDWSIQEIPVDDESARDRPTQISKKASQGRRTLLAFPFEAHSLVMAALSRKHLMVTGHAVELLCYPDTADGPSWFWGEALAESRPTDFARLVVIGDRPNPTGNLQRLETIERWQAAGVTVSLLNRHEANWSQLPDLLQLGVEVILGGDWAYFWGDEVDQADLAWGRIAALCTRDPTQAVVGLTTGEQAVSQGLLKVIYDVIDQPADNIAGWEALAKPILDRIAADDRTYFANQADGFAKTYASTTHPGRVEGQVLRLEQAPGRLPQAYYWALEAAIERHGRAPERGIRFNVSYAIATWSDGDDVELLAINHWRDEAAIPIRLLYPTDLGPPPEGNESAIRVRLSGDQAESVVQALVDACNLSVQ